MPSRRDTVLGLGLAGLTGAAVHAPALAAGRGYDLADPNDVVTAYARMRGHLDGTPGLWWYRGNMFAKRADDVAVRVLKIEGFSFNRLARRADGRFDQIMAEAGYFIDPDTDEIRDSWVNPLNGQTCTPRHYKSNQTIVVGPDGVTGSEAAAVPVQFTGTVEAQAHGGRVWTTENMVTKLPNPRSEAEDPLAYSGPIITLTSLAAFTGQLTDLNNDALAFMPATMHFQNLTSWLPWMKMGRDPGATTWQLLGTKVRNPDDMPVRLRRRLDADHPGWLENPGV
jgi:hypothetical protein